MNNYEPHDNVELIKKDGNVCVFELTPDNGPIREHRFYVVSWDGNEVKSIVPSDMPDSGTWFANGKTANAIGYVAGGRTRKNAVDWFRKLTA